MSLTLLDNYLDYRIVLLLTFLFFFLTLPTAGGQSGKYSISLFYSVCMYACMYGLPWRHVTADEEALSKKISQYVICCEYILKFINLKAIFVQWIS